MERIIHFDFKGAPLKISYLEKVLNCIKTWGATGILIEWEDTFPYKSELVNFGSIKGCGGDGMYTLKEVQHIMKFAKTIGLEVIQLVQTIGHMEFVLKHPQCANLRESVKSPSVVCPSKPDSFKLVCSLVQQTLDAQPDAKYIHIGADEQQRPELVVLLWDDMLRPISVEILQAYNLGELVEPVIWNYSPIESFQIESSLWVTYSKIFQRVLSPVTRYVSNQQAWRRQMAVVEDITFAGVVLTGWSRYEHYATLCELLPVSLPSLSCCLRVWDTPTGSDIGGVSEVLPDEQWPGRDLARCVHSFVMLRNRCSALLHGDMVSTWLNTWQVERQFTSPSQLECIASASSALLLDLKGIQPELSLQLHSITGTRSTEEWLQSFLYPIFRQIQQLNTTVLKRIHAGPSVCPA
ncbi:unnamed protein product [Leptidea sinapis]|uniref:beta-N-acetylhexosaminidase n=1 Tax=Leptidea sinapis TaxID=189913 RepID=A0A5E4PNM7_9NEOP|nr:unnamed protein product [Leptidea sinapis]